MTPTTTTTTTTGEIGRGLITRFRHFEYTTCRLYSCTYRQVVAVVEDKEEAVGVSDGRDVKGFAYGYMKKKFETYILGRI